MLCDLQDISCKNLHVFLARQLSLFEEIFIVYWPETIGSDDGLIESGLIDKNPLSLKMLICGRFSVISRIVHLMRQKITFTPLSKDI